MKNDKNLDELKEALLTLKKECEKHKFCRYCPLRSTDNNCYLVHTFPNRYKMVSEPMCAPALFIEQEKKQEKKDG